MTSRSLSTADAIRDVLSAAMAADPGVALLGEAVGRAGGVAGTCAGLRDAFGDERVRDLPVADRGTVGLALGLALSGRRPVVELADTSRLPAVLEVLADAVAIAAKREFPCPLVVRVPYGTEAAGLDRPVGPWLVPGLRVICSSDPASAAGLLRWALGQDAPVVILEPRALYPQRGTVGDDVLAPGARVLGSGRHVTLAGWGTGVATALTAAEALAAEGIDADVLDLVSLSPLDAATVGARVRETGRLVVVHPDDPGLARAVRQAALDEAFLYLEAPLADAPAASASVARAARDAVTY